MLCTSVTIKLIIQEDNSLKKKLGSNFPHVLFSIWRKRDYFGKYQNTTVNINNKNEIINGSNRISNSILGLRKDVIIDKIRTTGTTLKDCMK